VLRACSRADQPCYGRRRDNPRSSRESADRRARLRSPCLPGSRSALALRLPEGAAPRVPGSAEGEVVGLAQRPDEVTEPDHRQQHDASVPQRVLRQVQQRDDLRASEDQQAEANDQAADDGERTAEARARQPRPGGAASASEAPAGSGRAGVKPASTAPAGTATGSVAATGATAGRVAPATSTTGSTGSMHGEMPARKPATAPTRTRPITLLPHIADAGVDVRYSSPATGQLGRRRTEKY